MIIFFINLYICGCIKCKIFQNFLKKPIIITIPQSSCFAERLWIIMINLCFNKTNIFVLLINTVLIIFSGCWQHSKFAEFASACLGQSRRRQMDIRALSWLLFTESCLWAIQTHQILKAWSFRFTHWEGGEKAARQTGQRTNRGSCGEEEVKRTVGY